MSFPTVNLYDAKDVSNEISGQTGPLEFTSMITGHKVEFKAFIESLTQSFKSSWNTENVYGRMDPVATFQNTQRTISISWTIPAASSGEAAHNLQAITALTMMLYPGYQGNKISLDNEVIVTANSISKPPLIKMKFANLIRSKDNDGLLGYIDGFDHQIEIGMGFFINKDKMMFPKVIKMTCNFTVLHQHDLGFKDESWITEGEKDKWIYGNVTTDNSQTTEETESDQEPKNENPEQLENKTDGSDSTPTEVGAIT